MENKEILICCKLRRNEFNKLEVIEFSLKSDDILKEIKQLEELMKRGNYDGAILMYSQFLREATQSILRG